MEHVQVLGVTVHNISLSDAKRSVERFLHSKKFHHIVTVNPDLVMMAREDVEYLNTLNRADLSTVDGIGIYLPFILQGKKPRGRISGSDFTEIVLEIAEQKNIPVFLMVNGLGLSTFAETKRAIQKKFPRLQISGSDIDTSSPEAVCIAEKEACKYPLILSNFGGRLQEISLARIQTLSENQSQLVIGTGGTFDFFTGKQKRAPIFIRKIGFEWLWRLILQPRRRLKRTWNYVFVYSFLCIKEALAQWIFSKEKNRTHSLKKSVSLTSGATYE